MSFVLEGVMFLWHGPATVHVPDILPHGPGFQATIGGVFVGFKDALANRLPSSSANPSSS